MENEKFLLENNALNLRTHTDFEPFDYDEFPKIFAKDDFRRQVRRTVKGNPVEQIHIDHILGSIKSNLDLKADDLILDIGCGNGELVHSLYPFVERWIGVDRSGYLISIANEYFSVEGRVEFRVCPAEQIDEIAGEFSDCNKAISYGVISYLSKSVFENLLFVLATQFSRLKTFYIGNIPDRERIANFSYPLMENPLNERSQIGRWWTMEEVDQSAYGNGGWKVEFISMPDDFYASHYRFDALLTRR